MKRILMIEDNPDMKAHDKGLDLSTMFVAKTVEDGIKTLSENDKFDLLYLDGTLPDGSYRDILTWLSDHLEKVPEEIVSISFMTAKKFYPMVQALQKSARRFNGTRTA